MWRPGYPLIWTAQHTGGVDQRVGLPPGYRWRFSEQVKSWKRTMWNRLLRSALRRFLCTWCWRHSSELLDSFIIMLRLPLSVPFALSRCGSRGARRACGAAPGMFLLPGFEEERHPASQLHRPSWWRRGCRSRSSHPRGNIVVRLRPILMRRFRSWAGLIPVAIGIVPVREQRASIAVTIIGGQTLCLLLTLLVVPVAYSYLAEFESWPWRERRAGF